MLWKELLKGVILHINSLCSLLHMLLKDKCMCDVFEGQVKIVSHLSCRTSAIFLSPDFNICFGSGRCSRETSYWDSTFKYPQHMFWLKNKKNYFLTMHSYLEACRMYCTVKPVLNSHCQKDQRWFSRPIIA